MAQDIIELTSDESVTLTDGQSWNPLPVDALGCFMVNPTYKMGNEVCMFEGSKGTMEKGRHWWRTNGNLHACFGRCAFSRMIWYQFYGKQRGRVWWKTNGYFLMTAMTWPIDLAEELKELDEELDSGSDYTQLLQSHLHYKMALLKPDVIKVLFGIVLSPLAS